MCASCGCGKLDDQMGDDRHLVMSDLKSAAEAAGISVQEVAGNIQAASGQQGQGTNGQAQRYAGDEQAQTEAARNETPGAKDQETTGAQQPQQTR